MGLQFGRRYRGYSMQGRGGAFAWINAAPLAMAPNEPNEPFVPSGPNAAARLARIVWEPPNQLPVRAPERLAICFPRLAAACA